jgi:BMFP domain-containing protein YqiC
MSIEFVIQAATAFLGGGGATWLLFYRLKVRREGGKLREEEFDAVSKIVKQAMNDLQELSQRIAELEREKLEILDQMSKIRKENEDLNATIRRMVRKDNPRL